VLVTPHDQLLFGFLQADGAKRLGTLTRYVDVRHVLVRATSRLRRYVVLALCAAETHRMAQLTGRADGRQHGLRQVVQARGIVQIHVLRVLDVPVVFVDRWLSPLYAVLVVCLAVVSGAVP